MKSVFFRGESFFNHINVSNQTHSITFTFCQFSAHTSGWNPTQSTICNMSSLMPAFECNSLQITIGDMGSLTHAYESNSVQITIGDMAHSCMLMQYINSDFFQQQWGKQWTSVLNCIFILVDMMIISSCILSIIVWCTGLSNLPKYVTFPSLPQIYVFRILPNIHIYVCIMSEMPVPWGCNQ